MNIIKKNPQLILHRMHINIPANGSTCIDKIDLLQRQAAYNCTIAHIQSLSHCAITKFICYSNDLRILFLGRNEYLNEMIKKKKKLQQQTK